MRSNVFYFFFIIFFIILITTCSEPDLKQDNNYRTIPDTPTGISIIVNSSSSVTINWNSVSGASGYYIYRNTSISDSFNQVGFSTSSSYTDTGLSEDTTYFYKVSAINSYGTSSQSILTDYSEARTLSGISFGTSLEEKLQWLKLNAESNTEYKFEITEDEYFNNYLYLSFPEKENIIIRLFSLSNEKFIYSKYASVFWLGAGVTLILDNNITLYGDPKYNNHIVLLNDNSKLIMNKGSCINGNLTNGIIVIDGNIYMNDGNIINCDEYAVYLYPNNNFIMNNGKISNNLNRGVFSHEATFIMNNGEISNNIIGVTSSGSFTMYDGRIYNNIIGVTSHGIFNMIEGEISNNNQYGVIANGFNSIFNLFNGEISNNYINGISIGGSGTVIMHNGSIKSNSLGGVSLSHYCTFTMYNGIISNNKGENGVGVNIFGNDAVFTMNGGKICNNLAGTVYYPGMLAIEYYRGEGAGVAVGGSATFIMNGGEISGNSAIDDFYKLESNGGGVYLKFYGTFYFTNGVIYGINEGENSNYAIYGSAFFDDLVHTKAQYGSFINGIWNSNGNLSTTNSTIRVINGILQ